VSLEDDLLRKGYLPETVPPSFHTEEIADFFQKNPQAHYLTDGGLDGRLRWAPYSASKRGLTRRMFAVVHPTTAHDLGRFITLNKTALDGHLKKSTFSLSNPQHKPDANRALTRR
jgi:hypothetical protein